MKRECEEITIKGQIVVPAVERLDLFDGSFRTGYRLKKFIITPREILASEEITAKLMTAELPHSSDWNWDNNLEIGWASWGTPINSRFSQFAVVDEDSVIVDDLYIDVTGDTGQAVNYLIVMERDNFPEYIGALNLVRNKSQGNL